MKVEKKTIRELVPDIIYGPVASRRFGSSLGINLSGSGKYCSFNCPYCFRGFNDNRPNKEEFFQGLAPYQKVIFELEQAMEKFAKGKIQDWTMAGNAEPTDYPHFVELVREVIALRNRKWPEIMISVLTNGMGMIPRVSEKYKEIVQSLSLVDRPCIKLDAGIPRTWRLLAAPAYRVTFDEWWQAVRGMEKPITQTLLTKGRIDNTTEEELTALVDRCRELAPREMHLYTINKNPADDRLVGVSKEELADIAKWLQDRVGEGIKVGAYY